MSQENVEVVRGSTEAFLQGDLDAAASALDPAVVWVEMPSLGPDASTYSGFAEVQEATKKWITMWSDYEFRVERYVDAGSDVVVLARESGQLKGAPVRREVGEVYTLSNGKVVLVRLYGSWDEALEAVGLSEEDLKPAE
jgi:ketosteroid isomerase-like protein